MDLSYFLRQSVNIFADILVLFIFLRMILSWFSHEAHGLQRFLYQVTEPLLSPIRRSIPSLGFFDLSPLVALLLIEVLRSLLNSLL